MNGTLLLNNFLSHIPAETRRLYNLSGASVALFLCLRKKPFVAVEQIEEEAVTLRKDIEFFGSILKKDGDSFPSVFFLPDPNGPEISGKRAEVVSMIREGDSLVTSLNGLKAPVWKQEDLKKNSLFFERGGETERDSLAERLGNIGYRRVSIVVERGEYCLKGWILDIFPSTAENPVRIEFFGDTIENMRSFDIESQKSITRIDSLLVLPATEPPSGFRLSSLMRSEWFFVDSHPPVEGEGEGEGDTFSLSRFDFKGEGIDAGLLSIRGHGIFPDERKTLSDFTGAVKQLSEDNRVIIVSSSRGQAERVRDILSDGGVIAPIVEKREVSDYEGRIAVLAGKLSSGLFLPGLLILTEREIFGERPAYRSLRKSKLSGLLTSMDDITPGDFVVHGDHGIGRFVNIQRERADSYETDLVVIEYAGGDRLYIPLYNINKIKKYAAEEGVLPHLDKLGGKTWHKKKERVRKAVKEMAERLLRLYAEREVAGGFAFSPDIELHREFYDFFPYEETPDQRKVIEEIGRDMEAERPMERLLCGDVGYGKTEVAMRSAFKAIYDGKQVAVLVPTTILCEQHYFNFSSRFSGFPVKIDYLSRFKSKREQASTMKALEKGETDIIIGTQGLLGKDISFHDLGLLIIDEEHRFGVGQKERIKELKKGVDVLTMTATPIPRTLQMALSGVRGMSLIETPPEERLAVRTIVSVFDEDLIREAIERELQRGGQVLFVHNAIFDIERIFDRLRRLLPSIKIAVAHGQMPERRLEEVMHHFFRRELDLLVSTNIVGSGLDIPSANTIIIDRADKMGLADLYQLRGRVGRSNVRAYAYFLIPGEDLVSNEAKKRLQAIRDMSFLGAGFRLAMKDLEIRGAGNLLGPQQSGHIHAVGFDMYMEMLERAVTELKGIEVKEEIEPSINLAVSAFIPESYIDDLTVRLSMYRRIANAKGESAVDDIESEMADRFGSLPDEVRRLLGIMRLKIAAKKLLLTAVSQTDGKVRFVFSDKTPVEMGRVFALQKIFAGLRFHKDGFEISLSGMPKGQDSPSLARDVLMKLL